MAEYMINVEWHRNSIIGGSRDLWTYTISKNNQPICRTITFASGAIVSGAVYEIIHECFLTAQEAQEHAKKWCSEHGITDVEDEGKMVWLNKIPSI